MSQLVRAKGILPTAFDTRHLPVAKRPGQQCQVIRSIRAVRPAARCKASRVLSAVSTALPDLLPLNLSATESAAEELHGYPLCVRAAFQNGEPPLRLAHWLIPNRLLVGRYPFVHNQYSDRQHGENQIKSLLESGVTTFLCLQAELPPQCEMKSRDYNGFYAYKPVATMLHASTGAPPDTEIKGSIRNKHLDQFLPQKRSGGRQEKSASSARSLDFLHFPIVDLSVPEESGVQGLIRDLLRRLETGEVIYMHCWGGRGRAGTIGACLLKAAYGIDGDEALQRVQRSFDTRNEMHYDGTLRKSPETPQQLQFVRSFQYVL